MIRLGPSLAGALMMLLAGFSPARASSWPAFMRDSSRSGRIEEQAAPPLALRWTYDLPGQALSSPVAALGRVYIGIRSAQAGAVIAVNAYTGEHIWTFQAGGWVDATPAVAEGRVFIPSRDGKLYCLDAATGVLLWAHDAGATNIASPAVLRGEVYLATGHPGKSLKVLDCRSGAVKRSAALSQFTASSPVIDPGTGNAYLGTGDGRYAAFRPDLSLLWPNPVQTQGGIKYATPALAQGRLIALAGDDDSQARSLDPATGFQVWASTFLSQESNQATSVAIGTDTAYAGAGSDPHTLYAISLSTGGVRWKAPLGPAGAYGIASSPALANDMVYVLSPQGKLYGIHCANGAVQVMESLAGQGLGSPAVANGWVYAAAFEGKLYGFESGRAAAILSPDELFETPEGAAVVTGTVLSPDMTGYKVEVGTGSNPAQWTLLAQGTQAVTRGPLAVWDTRDAADGVYTLRVSVQESPSSMFMGRAVARYTLSQTKNASVSSSSQTLALGDGTEIFIPADAIEGTDTLTVRKILPGTQAALAAVQAAPPAGLRATGIIREFKLASTPRPRFNRPVTIKIPYYAINPGNEDALRLCFYDESGQWFPLQTARVKKQEKRIWAEVDHFTLFQIMEFAPTGTLLQESQVYATPNPARGNLVTFKFYAGDTMDVAVRVYDVSGALAAEMSRAGVLGGNTHAIEWDVSGKASGVYIFVLEARTASGSVERVKKKLAVIH
ncbi:MAG: PQQ-binding-like beta-propeller repeat protein [Elusimicrobia bacterium]|nr:PQQ-binding-like beta-propeller repeat protein [Elusimicrobiota bacterium]